jgi:hypothetical protein
VIAFAALGPLRRVDQRDGTPTAGSLVIDLRCLV